MIALIVMMKKILLQASKTGGKRGVYQEQSKQQFVVR